LDRLLTPLLGPHLHPLLAALRTAVVGQIALMAVLTPIALWIESQGGNTTARSPIDFANLTPQAVLIVVAAAPIIENALMVGVLIVLGWLRLPAPWQVLTVGVLAGFVHLDPGEALFAAAPGLLFATMAWQYLTWARVKPGWLAYLATVALHAVWNALLTLWLGLVTVASG
jgi:membrane protease YdiL (CAAX protease family)